MDTGLYLDQELLELSQDQIDTVFAGYYEENANGNFYEMKKVVLAKIDEKWKEVLSVIALICMNKVKYIATIPFLIRIIGGTLLNLQIVI
ncbi:hypothetical protein ACA29_20995 [Lederbergia galactosidilytica]|uniref:Uncharacterized protein n=1 Tax=Lederbergia galactosidilytica TaxID=217031 RepID=A0A0Q9XYH9_9BACI|nr:hypothetical protein ACA29_20995 [Lederbergia galactosidilytica]